MQITDDPCYLRSSVNLKAPQRFLCNKMVLQFVTKIKKAKKNIFLNS